MKWSVIIPTFRRVNRLGGCLEALAKQKSSVEQVVVVCRAEDEESRAFVSDWQAEWRAIEINIVAEPGVTAAMVHGLAAARGDFILLTDDDAAPWPDWLERIELAFAADSRLGGIGGKDWQYKGDPYILDDGAEHNVGIMRWWGKVIGNHHHAAVGPPREVDVLKGVNCAFRAETLRQVGGFDTRLAGTGAQVHWELAVCLAIKRAGWKIVFDPAIGVDHFPAVRFDEDQRGQFNSLAQRNAVFNETLVLIEHFSLVRRLFFILWAFTISTRGSPGVFQFMRLWTLRQPNCWGLFKATMRGRLDGLRIAHHTSKGGSHSI